MLIFCVCIKLLCVCIAYCSNHTLVFFLDCGLFEMLTLHLVAFLAVWHVLPSCSLFVNGLEVEVGNLLVDWILDCSGELIKIEGRFCLVLALCNVNTGLDIFEEE